MPMKILLIVTLLAAAWIGLGCAVQRKFLFPGTSLRGVENPGKDIAGLEKIWLPTDAGKVEAWFLPGEGVDADNPGPALLYAHGNGEIIDYFPEVFERARAMGISVMLCEYRGYGRSAGTPTQHDIVGDFLRFTERLAARDDVDGDRIILLGRSLGTGVATQIAAKRPPAALILQSPFTSVAAMMQRFGIPRKFCMDPFESDVVLADLDVPTLIVHGRHDRIIPFSHGQELHKIAKRSTFIEYTCGHNDFPMQSDRYWDDLTAFLRKNKIIEPQ